MPAGWVSAGVGVLGAVSGMMSANQQADTAASAAANANAPWSQAQPFISQEFQPAQDALNKSLGMGTNSAYDGERVAALNGYQTQSADNAGSWASTQGLNTANQMYNSGNAMMNSGQGYGNNAQSLYNTATGTDPTQSFYNAGNQLANSSITQGLIDSANLNVQRELNQNQLPTLALNAAGSGNTDSTRTGIQSALLQSQAQQNMLANASNIQGQMFNTGLNTSQSQYNTNQQQALNANSQMANAYGLGSSNLMNGQTAASNNFALGQSAGGVFQGQQQAQDAAAQQQFTEQQNNPMSLIGNYMNTINGKWMGPAVSSVGATNPVSAGLNGALGGAQLGAGLYQKLAGTNTNTAMPGLEGGYNNVTGAGAFDSVDAYG